MWNIFYCHICFKIPASAITLSGDGTTHKHINQESKQVTTIGNDSDGTFSDSNPSTLFAGISTAENHTSETQFDGWKSMITEIFGIYKDSSLRQ